MIKYVVLTVLAAAGAALLAAVVLDAVAAVTFESETTVEYDYSRN